MPEIACPSCGTSYDTAGFEPGQRFRCHGDSCTERLTVPEAGARPPSVSDTPTPAPAAAAAPAVAAPASNYGGDDDVLEEKETPAAAPRSGGKGGRGGKGGKKRRGASSRRPAPPPEDEPRRRGNVPPAKSQAPMYAAIGGGGLLLAIIAIVMLSAPVEPRGGKKSKQPKSRFTEKDPDDIVIETVPDGGTGGGDGAEQPVAAEVEKPKTVRKPRKSKYDYTFVADAGFKSTFDKYIKQMYHEDPNIAQEGANGLYDAGNKDQLLATILNHLPTMNFGKIEDRTVASYLMDIVSDAFGDGVKEKVGDVVVVNANMNGKIGYVDAMRAWRAYYRDNGGKLVPGK